MSVRLRRYSDSFHISAVRDDSSSAPPVPGDCADYSPIWDQTRMASAVTKANNITQTCVHLAPHVPAWLCDSTSVMGALLNRRPGAHASFGGLQTTLWHGSGTGFPYSPSTLSARCLPTPRSRTPWQRALLHRQRPSRRKRSPAVRPRRRASWPRVKQEQRSSAPKDPTRQATFITRMTGVAVLAAALRARVSYCE